MFPSSATLVLLLLLAQSRTCVSIWRSHGENSADRGAALSTQQLLEAENYGVDTHKTCGAGLSDDEIDIAEADFEDWMLGPGQHLVDYTKTFTFNLHWHAITSWGRGIITKREFEDQVKVLNDAFKPLNVEFKPVGPPNLAKKPDWFHMVLNSDAERAMKHSLHRGGIADLNIYSVMSITHKKESLLGSSTFPWELQKNKQTDPLFKNDGVIIDFDTLPSGTRRGRRTGKSLVHEVGHWVGLYHVFHNGCDKKNGRGDYVDDTPNQANFTSGCPETPKVSCPDSLHPGPDSIYNYMDYSDDICRQNFTAGQYDRVVAKLTKYRNVL